MRINEGGEGMKKPKLVFGEPIPDCLIPKKYICEDCNNDNHERLQLGVCIECGGNVIDKEEK